MNSQTSQEFFELSDDQLDVVAGGGFTIIAFSEIKNYNNG